MNRLLQTFVTPEAKPPMPSKPPMAISIPAPVGVDDGQYEELDLDDIGSSGNHTAEFFSMQSKSPIIRSMGRSFDHGQPESSSYGPRSNESSASLRSQTASALFGSPSTNLSTQASYGSSSSLTSSAASLFEHEAPAGAFGAHGHCFEQPAYHAQTAPQEVAERFGPSSHEPPQETPYYAPATTAPGPFSPPREAASLFGDASPSDPFAQAFQQPVYHQPAYHHPAYHQPSVPQPSAQQPSFQQASTPQYTARASQSPRPQEAASLFGSDDSSDLFRSSHQPSPEAHPVSSPAHGATSLFSHAPTSAFSAHNVLAPAHSEPSPPKPMSPQPQEAASLFGDDDSSSAWGMPVAPPSPVAKPALVAKPVASPVFKSQASPLQRSVPPPTAPHVASPRPQEASSLFSDASSLFGPSSPVSQFSAAAKSPSPVSQFVARSPSPRPLEAASLFGTASPRRDEASALFVTKPSAQEMQPVHEPAPVSSTTSLFSNNPPSQEAVPHYPSFSAAPSQALASGSSPMQHAAPPAYTPPTTASFAQPRTPEHRPTFSTLPGGKQGAYSPAKPTYAPPRTPELGPTANLPTPMYSSNGQASSSVVSQPQALGHSPKHLSTAHAQPAAFAPPAATDSEARALGSSSWHHVAPPVYTPPKTMSAPPRTPELRSAPRTPVRGAPSADSPSFSLPATAVPVPRPRPKLRLNLESSMDKLSVASSPLHPALLPTPPRSTSRYVPLSPANSVRSDCSASTAGVYHLMTQYKAMAERLEKEKAELLQILTQQAEQFYAMQAYIEELQSARDAHQH